jgi:hypothetical protein
MPTNAMPNAIPTFMSRCIALSGSKAPNRNLWPERRKVGIGNPGQRNEQTAAQLENFLAARCSR